MYNADIAITDGTVVTMDHRRRVIENGVLLIKDNAICYVGESNSVKWKAEQIIDAHDSIVMPGLIDIHGHAGHGLIKSLGDHPDGQWLSVAEEIYFRNSTEQFWHAEARLSALERLKFGVTTGYSMLGNVPRTDDPRWALSHTKGVHDVGIRDMLGIGPPLPPWPKKVQYLETDKTKIKRFTHTASLEVTEEICSMYRNGDFPEKTIVHLSPSRIGDPQGLGEELLKTQEDAVVRMADDYDLLVNSHAYRGNIEYAYDNSDILNQQIVLAHCAGITQKEIEILAETETSVAHCPNARAIIRDWCPVTQLLDAGVNTVVASDGSGPDRSFCLFKDARTAARIHRIKEQDETLLPPGKLLEMVTVDAAQAVGLENKIGSLETGKYADVIVVDIHNAHQYPVDMPIHRLAYVTSGADVSDVIVNGEVLMLNYQVMSVDEEDVLASAQFEYELALDRSGLHEEAEPPFEQLWETHRPLK